MLFLLFSRSNKDNLVLSWSSYPTADYEYLTYNVKMLWKLKCMKNRGINPSRCTETGIHEYQGNRAQAVYGQFVKDKDSALLENSANHSIRCILWQAKFLASVFLCLASLYPFTLQTAESQREAGCSSPCFFLYIVLVLGRGSRARNHRKAQHTASKIEGLCNFTCGIYTTRTALLTAGMLDHLLISSAPAGSDRHRGNVWERCNNSSWSSRVPGCPLSFWDVPCLSVLSKNNSLEEGHLRLSPEESGQSRNAAAGFHVPMKGTENPPESRWGSNWSPLQRTWRHVAYQVTGISGTSLTSANLMGCFHSIHYQHQHSFLRKPPLLFSVCGLLGKEQHGIRVGAIQTPRTFQCFYEPVCFSSPALESALQTIAAKAKLHITIVLIL